jgi:hypothetical protein
LKILVTLIFAAAVFARSSPKFEAVTIKRADPRMHVTTPNSLLSNLIGFAYGIHPR